MPEQMNEEEIKKSIHRVLNDKDLNSELTEKGFRRAKEFTWQKTAAETFLVYKKLMK